jgi:hypothetical protein
MKKYNLLIVSVIVAFILGFNIVYVNATKNTSNNKPDKTNTIAQASVTKQVYSNNVKEIPTRTSISSKAKLTSTKSVSKNITKAQTPKTGYVKNYKIGKNKYTGYIKNNKPEGKGVMYYADGSIYNGKWKAGAYSGDGNYIGAKFSIVIIGKWSKGKMNGYCEIYKYYNAEYGFKVVYNGECKNGLYSGVGILRINYDSFYDPGLIYVGEFFDGQMDGAGAMYDQNLNIVKNGMFYDGELVNADESITVDTFYETGLDTPGLFKELDINPYTNIIKDGSLKGGRG